MLPLFSYAVSTIVGEPSAFTSTVTVTVASTPLRTASIGYDGGARVNAVGPVRASARRIATDPSASSSARMWINRPVCVGAGWPSAVRSEEHTSELQSLMRISYAVFCLKKKKKQKTTDSQANKNKIDH